MDIQAITPNYYSNPYNKTAYNKRANVTFQANYSKLLEEIKPTEIGQDLKKTNFVNTILEKVKGTINCSKKAVQEFVEDVYDKISKLVEKNNEHEAKNESLQEELRGVKVEYHEFQQGARAQYTSYQNQISQLNQRAKDAETVAQKAKQELAEMKERIAGVKPISEIGALMPAEVIKLLDEMVAHKIPARKSMWEFLTTGKGQEEALAQIERNNILRKASQDQILAIPEVSSKYEEVRKVNGINYTSAPQCALDMILASIKNAPDGDIIMSTPHKEQIKKNAMGILSSLAEKTGYYSSVQRLEEDLEKELVDAADFRAKFSGNLERVKKSDEYVVKLEPVEFDFANSKIKRMSTRGEGVLVNSYLDVAMWHPNYI